MIKSQDNSEKVEIFVEFGMILLSGKFYKRCVYIGDKQEITDKVPSR